VRDAVTSPLTVWATTEPAVHAVDLQDAFHAQEVGDRLVLHAAIAGEHDQLALVLAQQEQRAPQARRLSIELERASAAPVDIHRSARYKASTYGAGLLRMELSKDLVAASATPLVLAILAGGDSYGYAIIKRVAELSGGHLQWTDGMLYPVLHRLERQGFVAAKWGESETGRRRKYYRITKDGRAQLAAQREQWQAVDRALHSIWMKACTV